MDLGTLKALNGELKRSLKPLAERIQKVLIGQRIKDAYNFREHVGGTWFPAHAEVQGKIDL